jgi:membrane protein
LLTRTWHEFGDDHCTQMAAAIAYHVLFSFIPLVTFFIAILGFILRDPQRQQDAINSVLQLIPLQAGSGNNLVFDSIRNVSSQSGILTGIGLVGLLWGGSGIFGAIRAALNIAWDVKAKRGFITDKLLDVGAVLGLGVLLGASMVGTVALHVLETRSGQPSGTTLSAPLQILLTVAGLVLPATISFIAFLLLYRYVPNVRHGVRDVWPGALIAAILFEVGKHAFALYVAHFNRYQVLYGALGGVMLFMLWIYLSSIILLFGAELASEFDKTAGGPRVGDEVRIGDDQYA